MEVSSSSSIAPLAIISFIADAVMVSLKAAFNAKSSKCCVRAEGLMVITRPMLEEMLGADHA